MNYYPVFMEMTDRACLVVGAGSVGIRKIKGLLKSGARVTVVSPEADGRFETVADQVTFQRKCYTPEDLNGMFMVFAATDDAALNKRIQKDAKARHILCNVADAPAGSDFILPSVLNRGDLSIAVSTAGSSPAMARTVKHQLEKQFGPEYADLLRLFKAVRTRLLDQGHDPAAHREKFYRLVDSDVLEWIRQEKAGEIDNILEDIFGRDFRYNDLCLKKE